jgi:hypothetical protein
MRTDDFDFDLPRDLIAQHPVEPRDRARLLHVARTLSDHQVADLPDLLRPGDLLVTNDTKVIPARLAGRRDGAGVEVTLHQAVDGGTWKAFARPARKLATTRPSSPAARARWRRRPPGCTSPTACCGASRQRESVGSTLPCMSAPAPSCR